MKAIRGKAEGKGFADMTKAYFSISIIAAIALLLGACQQGTPVANNPQDDVGELHITKTEPTKTTTVEEFPLPNCGGTDKLTQSLGSGVVVRKGLTVGTKATLARGVEVEIPETVKIKLKQKVEDTYQEEYQTANSRSDVLNMTAAPGTHVVYIVQWEDSRYSSKISYVMNGAVYKVPYAYVLSVPKTSDSRTIKCPATEPAPSPGNPVISTPAQQPTHPPTPQPPVPQPGLCPDTVARSMVSEWNIGTTNQDNVQPYLDAFENQRKKGGGFVKGDTIPLGAIIATDFGNGESETWRTYSVKPIIHYRSWGLFEVTGSFSAPSAGSCITIIP
jgi:hypothetical protein